MKKKIEKKKSDPLVEAHTSKLAGGLAWAQSSHTNSLPLLQQQQQQQQMGALINFQHRIRWKVCGYDLVWSCLFVSACVWACECVCMR